MKTIDLSESENSECPLVYTNPSIPLGGMLSIGHSKSFTFFSVTNSKSLGSKSNKLFISWVYCFPLSLSPSPVPLYPGGWQLGENFPKASKAGLAFGWLQMQTGPRILSLSTHRTLALRPWHRTAHKGQVMKTLSLTRLLWDTPPRVDCFLVK